VRREVTQFAVAAANQTDVVCTLSVNATAETVRIVIRKDICDSESDDDELMIVIFTRDSIMP